MSRNFQCIKILILNLEIYRKVIDQVIELRKINNFKHYLID